MVTLCWRGGTSQRGQKGCLWNFNAIFITKCVFAFSGSTVSNHHTHLSDWHQMTSSHVLPCCVSLLTGNTTVSLIGFSDVICEANVHVMRVLLVPAGGAVYSSCSSRTPPTSPHITTTDQWDGLSLFVHTQRHNHVW